MNFKKFYEGYHRDRKLPKRIVGDKNFTYRIMLAVLNKYCLPKDVLDIGSGVGTIDLYLASKGKNVTGIEISQRAFDIAVKSAKMFGLEKKIQFKRVDIFRTRLKKKYSFVICSEVLEHLPFDKKALQKIYKMTKQKGLLMLTVPSKNAPLIRLGAIENFDKRSGHLRRYTTESAKKLLKETGFKTIYSKKAEGIIRNFLFVFRWNYLIKIANRVAVISDLITFFDDISLKLFGESDLILIAKKV
jgi:2-polyprenyl-3-methyl-5-hydroxy-6-metoxy-1,4-benzoquinol methylase